MATRNDSIIDEILYVERVHRERYRTDRPRFLIMSSETYEQLCTELDTEDIDVYHGMDISIDDSVDDFVIQGAEFLSGDEDEDYGFGETIDDLYDTEGYSE